MKFNELVNSIVFRVSGLSAFRRANSEVDKFEDSASGAAQSTQEFEEKLDKAERAGRRFGRGIRRAGGRLKNFVGGILGFLPAVLGVGSVSFAGLGAAAIGMASDTQEAQSLMRDILGQNADDLEQWSIRNARSYNASTNELRKFASGFATQFKSLTNDADEVVQFSQEFTARALDLASQRNRNAADVANDFTSALNGSSETVEKYGVNLKEAALTQFILQTGMASTRKEITESDKRLARYRIILRDTSDAQGNAARTSSDFANVLKNLRGRFRDLLSGVGERLIPIATRILKSITASIEENQEEIIKFFENLSSRVQKFIDDGGLQKIVDLFEDISEFIGKSAIELNKFLNITDREQSIDAVEKELLASREFSIALKDAVRFSDDGRGARQILRDEAAFRVDQGGINPALAQSGFGGLLTNATTFNFTQQVTVDASGSSDPAVVEKAVRTGTQRGVVGFQRRILGASGVQG